MQRCELISVDVDGRSGEAEYLQVARQVRDQIISGKLPVGERLPSSRTMQAAGVGRVTWMRALAELESQGLVTIRKGQTAWVTSRPAVVVVEVRAGDRIAARAATEDERGTLGAGRLSPVLVITRADGAVEVHPAAVTVCSVTCS